MLLGTTPDRRYNARGTDVPGGSGWPRSGAGRTRDLAGKLGHVNLGGCEALTTSSRRTEPTASGSTNPTCGNVSARRSGGPSPEGSHEHRGGCPDEPAEHAADGVGGDASGTRRRTGWLLFGCLWRGGGSSAHGVAAFTRRTKSATDVTPSGDRSKRAS